MILIPEQALVLLRDCPGTGVSQNQPGMTIE